ncbi:uncharacterized protein LOC125839386 [Solanum verrucosum]|uniref:uncharacterized protein LOC125839386 n=1 Tax=Solanum verrucosum TaxID=315347 RepID=UPI0020D0F38B|nr:uncharacterized protein LOC125839386 [Solanum verrucosum]
MAFHERFFAPSRIMKLRDDIKNFKQQEGEPIHESRKRLTQEQLDKEREMDENIKKMFSQIKVIQKHMKGTYGVFRIEEGSSFGYLRPGENQGWNSTSKLNSHADAIKTPEGQLRLLSAQLTSRTLMKDNERRLLVVSRIGKMEESQGIEEQELSIPQNLAKEPQEDAEQHVQVPKVMHPLPKIPPPFPQRLKSKKEDEKFKNFLSVFKNLSIDLPLVEALSEMLGYAKFMKELVTKKRCLDYETIEVPHSCSAIMTNESITKKADPGKFTILCTIGKLQLTKALCDLGESINLMPYAIYKQLGLGEPKATTMRLLMADRSIQHPMGYSMTYW